MSETIRNSHQEIPSENYEAVRQKIGEKAIALATQELIDVGDMVDRFSDLDRIPRTSNGERENDVHHSYMLALAAPGLANKFYPRLDRDLVTNFSLVHDLLELEAGDVATFDLSPEALAEKKRREEEALPRLLEKLPENLREPLQAYESQESEEARFVRFVDKLLPLTVDIVGQGERVVEEDYGIKNLTQLQEVHNKQIERLQGMFGGEFPELLEMYKQLTKKFEQKYDTATNNKKAQTPERPSNHVEVERKWLINPEDLPEDIEIYKRTELRQGYIAIAEDGSETRIRSFDDSTFELTTKTKGTTARHEQTIRLSPEMFEALWPKAENRRIEKTRYYIPYMTDDKKHTIELDIYHGNLDGLITAEVEFAGREADASVASTTFKAPAWFDKEVSEDGRYKNQSLALADTFPHE